MPSGTQIDLDFRETSHSRSISPRRLRSLQDLLVVLSEEGHGGKGPSSMLWTTAAHLARAVSKPLHEIALSELEGLAPHLRSYLEERRFKRNSVRSYINYHRLLLVEAKKLGWTPQPTEAEIAWERFLPWFCKRRGCPQILQFAIRKGKNPRAFSERDLDDWTAEMFRRGRKYAYVKALRGYFRKQIHRNGLAAEFPMLSPPAPEPYGIPLKFFPEPLRTEVQQLLTGKPQNIRLAGLRRGSIVV
ncbi:MAG: hypothetical protein HY313_08545 [Acidobacteria bacterium]|nr:hypothetical protein [Acidobacteriota bacterium]